MSWYGNPAVSKCYDQWLRLQGKVDAYYHDKPRERIPLSRQKEFRQIKNAVIQETERLRLGEITFEEKDLGRNDEPEEFQRLLDAAGYHSGRAPDLGGAERRRL